LLEGQDDGAALVRLQTLTNPSAAPRSIRPSTECVSSSQCQISKDSPLHARRVSRQRPQNAKRARERNRSKSHRKDGPPRAPRLSHVQSKTFGGARRDRTDDLMLAKHALSQLSYGPVSRPAGGQRPVVVGLGGLEPPTSRLSSARSNQLSYKPGRKKKPGARSGFQNQRRRKSSISLSERETKAARSRKMRPD
jgi:hypothetical protein